MGVLRILIKKNKERCPLCEHQYTDIFQEESYRTLSHCQPQLMKKAPSNMYNIVNNDRELWSNGHIIPRLTRHFESLTDVVCKGKE